MCWTCNPYCGGCKPPKPKPMKCLSCNTYNLSDRETCPKCGQPFPKHPAPTPTMCLYLGQMCGNPCHRHKKLPDEGVESNCPWHTPVRNNNQ